MDADSKRIWESLTSVQQEKEFVDYSIKKQHAEPELDWYKSRVKEWAGDKPTVDSMMDALERAWTGTNPRFHYQTLHAELLKMRGASNKNRKFMQQGYYPDDGKFDPKYMKDWLQREIMGEFMMHQGGRTYHVPR